MILTGDQASEHENSVVDVRDSADLVPPAGNDDDGDDDDDDNDDDGDDDDDVRDSADRVA